MLQLLSALRHKCAIGFVGGSDLVKQQEQLGTPAIPVTTLFDFCFAENGLTAFRLGQQLASQSFVCWLGEERYKQLVNYVLKYLADIECPVKRGTFVEFRYVGFGAVRGVELLPGKGAFGSGGVWTPSELKGGVEDGLLVNGGCLDHELTKFSNRKGRGR